jgi:hypothetical protein
MQVYTGFVQLKTQTTFDGLVVEKYGNEVSYSMKVQRLYRMSQNLCHKIFLGIPHPHLSKNVPINMGPKVNRFRDIHCCVELREML